MSTKSLTKSVKIETIVFFIDLTQGLLTIISLIGIIISFYLLDGLTLYFSLFIFCLILLISFSAKSFLINEYVKESKYPFELISVLEHLGMVQNIHIKDRVYYKNSNSLQNNFTTEFLSDNGLNTKIYSAQERKLVAYLTLFGTALISGIFYVYGDEKLSEKGLGFTLLTGIVILIYFAIKSKKITNKHVPVIEFDESGLTVYSQKFEWSYIESWECISHEDTKEIVIKYKDGNDAKKIETDLHKLNVSSVGMLLLLAHYKNEYSANIDRI